MSRSLEKLPEDVAHQLERDSNQAAMLVRNGCRELIARGVHPEPWLEAVRQSLAATLAAADDVQDRLAA